MATVITYSVRVEAPEEHVEAVRAALNSRRPILWRLEAVIAEIIHGHTDDVDAAKACKVHAEVSKDEE